MSSEQIQKPCKQRYKGVENFLRRMAFNLGNTASQTEVKIISCIPIDVTDLQQKIITLEKQLREAKGQPGAIPHCSGINVKCGVSEKSALSDKEKVNEKCSLDKTRSSCTKPTAVVNTALFDSSYPSHSNTFLYCTNKPPENMNSRYICEDCTSKRKKSIASFLLPTASTPKADQTSNFSSQGYEKNKNNFVTDRYINIFKKRKRKRTCKGKGNVKTHLVYYAQHKQTNPFYMTDIPITQPKNHNAQPMHTSQAYLCNVMRRQYDPKYMIEIFSDTSHFSKPVCRDTGDNGNSSLIHESDICSCCHGRFQNVDNYMTENVEPFHGLLVNNGHNANTKYNDSNLYDTIPVKENANKLLKDDIITEKEITKNIEINCWPQNLHTKYKYAPRIANYQTEICDKFHPNKKSFRKEIKSQGNCNIKKLNQLKHPKRARVNRQITDNETFKSCSVDCGDVYPKHIFPAKTKLEKCEPIRTILLKNVFVETDDVNTNLKVHNQSTQLELVPYENKTESTLNQIKSILQSVLTEVKTNTKVNNIEETHTKDAVVQIGTSQNNMQGDSTFLHSFTYNNSYNKNPYLPSCSQVPTGQCCVPGVPCHTPGKYFPVFIQHTSGKHMCACYYRKSLHKPSNKQALATSTNTDKEMKKTNSKEAEKLIKEIYKSMALNMDYPTKDNSMSEYDDLKSGGNDYAAKFDKEKVEDERSTGTDEINKRDIETEALLSSSVSHDKLIYNAASTQSKDKYNERQKISSKNVGIQRNVLHELTHRSSDAIIEDEEEENSVSSSESDNDEVVILDSKNLKQKKEKQGIFQRMLKTFKLFKKGKTAEKHCENEVKSDDDDSDYETIYSGRSIKLARRNVQTPAVYRKQRASYLADINQSQINDRTKKRPYLEQEYRRQWNEKLMFERREERQYSSERPFSKKSSSSSRQPVYWTNYEARNALIEHDLPIRFQNCNSNLASNVKENPKNPSKFTRNRNIKDKLGWLKKQKIGINCGEQWKKFILEN